MGDEIRFAELAAPPVRGLHPYVPGKPVEELEREYGISNSIKLASNENPLGPPAPALAALREAETTLALYPDGAGFYLKHKLAERLGVTVEQITLGNGSNDVLAMLAEAFLQPGDEAIYDRHGFIVYALVVQATGATPIVTPSLSPHHDRQPLGHDAAGILARVGPKTRIVFIANPNNPTGSWLARDELLGLLEQVPRHVLVVLDEAYAEYVTEPDYPAGLEFLPRFPNLVVTRTFSKAYALAGLRIGYGVSHPALAELLNRIRQPFNTNTLAQVAAMAALEDEDFLRRSRELNTAGLRQLTGGLTDLGFGVLPSVGNFVLVDMGRDALPYYETLLRAGIIVRPVGNYGLPNHLRITVGLPEQNAQLLAVLASGAEQPGS
ncbi:MAG: histidinol-phosphate transaminase [Gammaproteobacteria bacterium]|nr:histidinol-phosphate transaminase [Gammaproteobacteria bacterium]